MSGRAGGSDRRGWIAGGVVATAAVALFLAWWTQEGGEIGGGETAFDPLGRDPRAPAEIVPVGGNPGYESLSEAERERAARPLSADAIEWIEDHRAVIREVARSLDVSPVALGGIVAAEKTLLVGRVDALGEALFRSVFGSLREIDLRRWIARQEARYRRERAGESAGRSLRNPYEWTLGPAQVSFRLAVQYEPRLARRMGRPERSAREIVAAVTSTPGNLEYAAALLAESERAYRIVAGMDIADNPGVLATLYHVGAPTVRARRLASENGARVARGEAPEPPQVNYYGAFVNLHAAEIARLLLEADS